MTPFRLVVVDLRPNSHCVPAIVCLDSLQRFRVILAKIDEAKRKMGRVMQLAAFSLAEVTYAAGGDIAYMIQESVGEATFQVRAKQENVSGTILPAFEAVKTGNGGGGSGQQQQQSSEGGGGTSTPSGSQASRAFLPVQVQLQSTCKRRWWLIRCLDGCTAFGLTGLGRGGQQINRCRETFAKAVETLVELASLQVCPLSRFILALFSQRSGAIWPVSPSRESAARSEPVRPGQGNRALTGPFSIRHRLPL